MLSNIKCRYQCLAEYLLVEYLAHTAQVLGSKTILGGMISENTYRGRKT